MSDDKVYVFDKNVPISCWLHQVYDPDVDGDTPSANGKYILEPSSHVIDQDTSILYYVHSVDSRYKHDIRPARLLVLNEADQVSIVSYGNDMFFLLFDDRTNPTILNIDSKLILLGVSVHEYRLVKVSDDGVRSVISLHVDADGKVRGDRIPMGTSTCNDVLRFATSCHTTYELTEGEMIEMEVFDTSGIQCASLTLFVRRAILQNDLASTANPIIRMDAECHQMRGEDFFIYQKQDTDELNIIPYLIYADGTRRNLDVDNKVCFVHGLDDYVPSFPGYSQPLVIKYHLGTRETSAVVDSIDEKRVLSIVKKLVTINNLSTYAVKVSVVPRWNSLNQAYDLQFFAYTDKRDRIYPITDAVTITSQYVPNLYGIEQEISISVDMAPFYGADEAIIHQQNIYLTLKQGNTYERYVIKDSKHADKAYGVEAGDKRRPVIHYDQNTLKYFIPTTIFTDTNYFLENFYYEANPMHHPLCEDGPPRPTHFTIRSSTNGSMLIVAAIPVIEYGQSWSTIAVGSTDQLVGQTVVVEFLEETSPGTYSLLYGVPVEVYISQTVNRGGFNTPSNNLFAPIYL